MPVYFVIGICARHKPGMGTDIIDYGNLVIAPTEADACTHGLRDFQALSPPTEGFVDFRIRAEQLSCVTLATLLEAAEEEPW